MPYLLAISFLLHFITLFILVILVQKINAKDSKETTHNYDVIKNEIEDLLLSYTSEMKEENEKILKKIVTKKEKLKEQTSQEFKIVNAKKELEIEKIDEPEPFTPPQIVQQEDKLEQSTTAKILSLSSQGYSAKEIAKKLNMGDGEVELLLKFHK